MTTIFRVKVTLRFGVSRDSFYEWRKAYLARGDEVW